MAKDLEDTSNGINIEVENVRPQPGSEKVVAPPRRPTTKDRSTEMARMPIAVMLLALIGIPIVAAVALCFYSSSPVDTFERLLGKPVLPLLMVLLATVIGYYFGRDK